MSAEPVAPPPRKSGWEILQIVGGVMSPILLAVLAYFLTGRITIALQERQLNLASGKEIQTLMNEAITADTPEKATAAAVGLAAYGDISVPPLTYLLRSRTQSVSEGAVEGIRAVATTHPAAVCNAMRSIVENRTRIYSWENHLIAIQLIGQLQCPKCTEALRRYDDELDRGKLPALTEMVSESPPPDRAAFDKLRAAVHNTEQSLQ